MEIYIYRYQTSKSVTKKSYPNFTLKNHLNRFVTPLLCFWRDKSYKSGQSGFEFPADIYNCQITSYQTFCTSTATAQTQTVAYKTTVPAVTSDTDYTCTFTYTLKVDSPSIVQDGHTFFTTRHADNFKVKCKMSRSFDISSSSTTIIQTWNLLRLVIWNFGNFFWTWKYCLFKTCCYHEWNAISCQMGC